MSSNWLNLRSVYIIFDLDGRFFRENCHVCMRAIGASVNLNCSHFFTALFLVTCYMHGETQKFGRQFLKLELGLDHIRFLSRR